MTPTALILTAVAVVFLNGLVAVIVERTEQRDEAYALVAKAHKTATDAVAQTEVFADELIAEHEESAARHAANMLLTAELAASDEKIRRLSNDLLAAQLLANDAREELAAAPAPVIPLPVVREASPYDWPVADGHFPVHTEVNDDDIEALMRATEEN